jgi:hypothetical protein
VTEQTAQGAAPDPGHEPTESALDYGTPELMTPAEVHLDPSAPETDAASPGGPPSGSGLPPLPPGGEGGQGGYEPTRRWVLGASAAVFGLANLALIARLATKDQAHGSDTRLRTADASPTSTAPGTSTTTAPSKPRNIIEIENARPGTNQFAVRMEEPWVDLIHAWCDHDSAHHGDTVTLYATTRAATFTAEVFRFGYYAGATGRHLWAAPAPIAGIHQDPPTIDPVTNMRSCAHWTPSLRVKIPTGWTPGMYMFRLTSSDGGATFVPLTVLDDRRADLLVVSAITTWNAYNLYGGASLYGGADGRSKVVTFDRPYDQSGSGHFFGGEYELVQQVESMGIDVAYTTNIDLHARPEQIEAGGYQAVVSLAHDEYYSVPIRRSLEAARDRGVNLLFLGANAGYRRIRLERSLHGAHRLQVNYRVPHQDPLYGKGDQELVTAEWRSPPAAEPEASLVGNYYESNPVLADMVVANPSSWVFAGTGLAHGARFAAMVQNEYDRVTPEVSTTPANIEVLCHSPVVCRGHHSYADVTYYTAASGAGVFATGTLWWERQLGPLCTDPTGPHTDQCQLRRITANVLEAFLAGPAGRAHPSSSNLAALGIRSGYLSAPPTHVEENAPI